MAGHYGRAQRRQIDDAIAEAIDADRREIYTALPGRIVSFDPSTQRATVELMHRPLFNGEPAAMPNLIEVPVVMPRGGGFAFTFPIRAGDGVQVMFQSRDMETYYEQGTAAPAATLRMHDLSDAVAVPGLEPAPRALGSFNPSSIEIRSEDGQTKIEITSAGKIALESGGEELVQIVDDFMAVVETHTHSGGSPPDQAAEIADIRARLTALLRA